VRLGFACPWNRPPETTWSYIPWRLRAALAERVSIVELPLQPPRVIEGALFRLQPKLHRDQPAGAWRYLPLEQARRGRRLRSMVASSRLDAVVSMEAVSTLSVPQWLYQDLGMGVLDGAVGTVDPAYLPIFARDQTIFRRRRERHLELFASGAGVLAMSQWNARALVDRGLVPEDRVRVVHAGISATPPVVERGAPGRRLLFVGRDFFRKAGDLVVAAVQQLRAGGDAVTLTVVGPDAWPLPGAVPDGVRFLGRLSSTETGALYVEHDAFVMPSRFEAFGIVFAEALAAGIPCIARDAFAMPEIVSDGVDGILVTSEDLDELAGAIARVLDDGGFAERAWSGRVAIAERFSWDAVADRVLEAF
jgi:glycosyltransferase involved in cell wall biosynthesis